MFGDAPVCEPILRQACPKREPVGAFAATAGPCDAVSPQPVGKSCKHRVAGCAGVTRHLCDRVCSYCASIKGGATCRLLNFARSGGANAYCGHRGRDAEWEPVGSQPVVTVTGVVSSGGDTSGCPGVTPCPSCGLPRYGARDSCLTHDDRDFVLNLAVGEAALPLLSPANMVGDRSHPGRDLDVETEWMYLFAPYRGAWLFAPEDKGYANPLRLGPRLTWRDDAGVERDLGVPAPGDAAAAQGVLAADCGHLDERGFARTELHPALTLVWVHAEAPGRWTAWVRAATWIDDDVRRFRLRPLRAVLPLPGGAAGRAVEVASFRWDYAWRGQHVVVDRGCTLSTNGDHQQEHPTAHLAGADGSEALRLAAAAEPPGSAHESSAFTITFAVREGALVIELLPREGADAQSLAGARAELIAR